MISFRSGVKEEQRGSQLDQYTLRIAYLDIFLLSYRFNVFKPIQNKTVQDKIYTLKNMRILKMFHKIKQAVFMQENLSWKNNSLNTFQNRKYAVCIEKNADS